jgi:hypothetical protein
MKISNSGYLNFSEFIIRLFTHDYLTYFNGEEDNQDLNTKSSPDALIFIKFPGMFLTVK